MHNKTDDYTIIITGVAGLLGWNFAKWLLNNTNHRVIGIDAMLPWGNFNEVPDNIRYEFHRLQLGTDSSQAELDKLVETTNAKVVYHFASYAALGLSPFMRKFNYIQNTIATTDVINACIKYGCKLIYTSSLSVYGIGACKDRNGMYNENDIPVPIDPYGISKYGCEMDIRVAGDQHHMDWVIVRPHNVFGEGQNVNDKYRNVLGIWMHQAYTKQPMTIYGDGEQERAFTYIGNIMKPLYNAIGVSREIINLGGKVGISINDAYRYTAEVTGWHDMIHLDPRHEVKWSYPDPAKSIQLLDYDDSVSFRDGLQKMWDWVVHERKVGEWYEWDTFEVDKGIYPYWKRQEKEA